MFNHLKNIFLKKYLFDNKPNRQRNLTSLTQAKNIAILCEITDEDSYKDIFSVFSQLREQGHDVKMIGYVDDKFVPFYCLPKFTADYFCCKDLNWYGLPALAKIHEFTKIEYDILIDFNQRLHTPVLSILSLTHAKFIVGRNSACQHLYDLFIDAAKFTNAVFIENVNSYTNKFMGYDR